MNLVLASRNVLRQSSKFWTPTVSGFQSAVPFNTSVKKEKPDTFLQKNERLQRPLSPHLTIYKFQVTSMLSVTHRATGIALSGGLYGLSLGTLVLSQPFPVYFEYLQSLHIATPLIFSFKFALAWMVFYHSANGIRHLFWDMGYGYDLKTLYTTGYAVIGISTIASLVAAAM